MSQTRYQFLSVVEAAEPSEVNLICSFPRWSPEAVIAEAARNWNMLHPSRPFDPANGSWTFARIVIDSWLRHDVSNYDGKETNN